MRKKHLLKDDQISTFCQQLYMAINAGIPAYEGVSILIDDAADGRTKDLLTEIFEPMQLGGSLHEALEKTGVFPAYMVRMIELGEETGKLEEVLVSLAAYYDREAKIRENVRYAVSYPAFMFLMMLAVIVILITKALPVFSHIYEQLGTELTGTAHLLMQISVLINRYLVVLIVVVLVFVITSGILYHTKVSRKLFQHNKLSFKIAVSRFANCMYLAISSGQGSDKGLELSEQLIDMPRMKEKIKKCRELVEKGEPFSSSVFLAEIFPKMYASWISIAYTTGDMDHMMKKICDAYEEETDQYIQHFISLLEPVLIAILSIFIGVILVSFLLPLMGIMSSIG